MIAAMASAADLARQCSSSSYVIPFLVQTGAPIPSGSVAPLKINVRYRVNDESDTSGTPTYNTLLSTTDYVDGSTYVNVTIPNSIQTNKNLKLSFISADGSCVSNELVMNEPAIRLPNTTLSVNFTGINNSKQCNPNVVTFKFNVSHWQIAPSYTERAPYTFNYSVNNGPIQTVVITTNQQVINAVKPPSSSAVISYTITDNKGCTTNGTLPTILTPTTALVAQVNKTNTAVPLPLVCRYSFTATGGIGAKTSTRPLNVINNSYVGPLASSVIANPVRTTFCSVYPSPALVATITDSVGCTIIKST